MFATIRSAVGVSEGAKSTKWDLRSDGRHPSMSSQMPQVNDHESDGRQQNKTCKIDQNKAGNLPELIKIGCIQEAHFRQIPFDSNYSEEKGYVNTLVNNKCKFLSCNHFNLLNYSLCAQRVGLINC